MPVLPELTDVEKDKLKYDPDFDFASLTTRELHDLDSEQIAMFKWAGTYQQLQKGFFMIRLRLPGGLMTAAQMERAADLAEMYAQDELCITTRQTLQFHWVRKDDLHRIMQGMEEVGINTRNACGDVTRNVITCSLQGVCPHEIGDTRKMLLAIADDPELLNDQRNLPRKHKISVSGCGRACGQTLMNCQGWYPVKRLNDQFEEETGWKFHAGGGLGARPYMAQVIFDWVPEDLVLDVTRAAAEVFRRKGNRRIRAYSRLKYVVDKLGSRGFGEACISVMRERGVQGWERIEFAAEPVPDVGELFLDGQAVIPQRQAGFSTVRVMIDRSELRSAELRRFAQWTRDFGNGELMYTNRQNVELRFVPDDKVDALLAELHAAGYRTEGHERLPDMVACVGTTYCNLAVSDTPNTYWRLRRELTDNEELWKEVGHLRINMNGCPNSCAQHWTADIGLRGTRETQIEGSDEGFSLFVGGSLAGPGHIAQHVCDLRANQASAGIRRLLEVYLERREAGERFGDFVRRVGPESLREWMGPIPLASETPVNIRNLHADPLFNEALKELA